jgi:hypothetical protein
MCIAKTQHDAQICFTAKFTGDLIKLSKREQHFNANEAMTNDDEISRRLAEWSEKSQVVSLHKQVAFQCTAQEQLQVKYSEISMHRFNCMSFARMSNINCEIQLYLNYT